MVTLRRHIPNLITIARLVLTVVFFTLLNVHRPDTFAQTMWVAFVVFLIAALTDILDGYLARHWKVESAFGRVVDPFVDKILVCGAFVFFSSTEFINPALVPAKTLSITGVAPWMAVVLIGREFLITSLRGLAEAKGIPFPADWSGKIKMVIQSFAVGAIIVDVATITYTNSHLQHIPWIQTTALISIWLTLLVTVASGTTYILRARRIFMDN